MANSNEPIKFAHLQKLVNQLTLNGKNVIEITETCTVALMKARKFLFFRFREKCVKTNRRWWKYVFWKNNKVVYDQSSIKWNLWKGNDMLLKLD